MSHAAALGFAIGFGVPAAVAVGRHAFRMAARRYRTARLTAYSAGLSTSDQRAAATRVALACTTAVRAGDRAAVLDLVGASDPAVLVHALSRLVVHHAAMVAHYEQTTTDAVLQRCALRVARLEGTTP